ncbi:hypothetical protein ACSSZE_12390 [Acidithiobacillus caldus]
MAADETIRAMGVGNGLGGRRNETENLSRLVGGSFFQPHPDEYPRAQRLGVWISRWFATAFTGCVLGY